MEANNKFTIIYTFAIVEGKENTFINCWTELTKLIYKFEGSYGSRLHKVNDSLFIGYAQWPDKETYDKSGNNLPEEANSLRETMRKCCSEIKPVYEMLVVKDLLSDKQFT